MSWTVTDNFQCPVSTNLFDSWLQAVEQRSGLNVLWYKRHLHCQRHRVEDVQRKSLLGWSEMTVTRLLGLWSEHQAATLFTPSHWVGLVLPPVYKPRTPRSQTGAPAHNAVANSGWCQNWTCQTVRGDYRFVSQKACGLCVSKPASKQPDCDQLDIVMKVSGIYWCLVCELYRNYLWLIWAHRRSLFWAIFNWQWFWPRSQSNVRSNQ